MDAIMTLIRRITRNSNPLTGLVTATIGLLIMFSVVSLSDVQIGAILTFVGALILFLSAYITPVSDPRLAIGTIVNDSTDKMPTGIVTELLED